jgi:hypothetical protein
MAHRAKLWLISQVEFFNRKIYNEIEGFQGTLSGLSKYHNKL